MKRNQKKGTNDTNKSRPTIKKSMRECSLQEIGDVLGLTRMRICQLEKVILEKIKNTRNLEEFEIE
jgi:DNA-directed RNA polymerase sigma subunit (sigma70/sigma32)